MRERPVRRLRHVPVALLALLACASLAASAPEPVRVKVSSPQTLRVGEHVALPIEVELANDSDQPVLLTLQVEGNAVEVVRGRLLSADAKRKDARHLAYEAPIIARAEGTAILRVEVATYVCRVASSPASRCEHLVVNASQTLRVSPK